MEADLFPPSDLAALLAVRKAMADQKLSPIQVRTLFESYGLIRSLDSPAAANELLQAASLGGQRAA